MDFFSLCKNFGFDLRVREMEGVDYLADERKKAGFDVDEMKIVWAGSRHDFELTDRISKLVASDPVNPLTLFCFFFSSSFSFSV